jgi:hypothetical protein
MDVWVFSSYIIPQICYEINLTIALLYQSKAVHLLDVSRCVEILKTHETHQNQGTQRVRTIYGGKSQRRNRRLYGNINYERTLDERDQPLSTFLDFGNILPLDLKETISGGEATSSYPTHIDKCIEVSHIGYHTLNKVADVQIQWVHDITTHLQFDTRSKKLNIFQYPSVCLIFDSSESVLDDSRRPTILTR